MGCSNGAVSISSNGYSVQVNGKELAVTEHRGFEATEDAWDYDIEYYLCDTTMNCPHNSLGVYVEDMSKYKDALYYQGYHGTQIFMYVPYGDIYVEAFCQMSDIGILELQLALEKMYDEAKALLLADGTQEVTFQDIVKVKVADRTFKVRPTEIVIPGLVRVSASDGTIVEDESIIMGDKLVGYKSTGEYDYYIYNGIVVQLASGLAFDDFVSIEE